MFSGVLHYMLYALNILAQGGIHCISFLHELFAFFFAFTD